MHNNGYRQNGGIGFSIDNPSLEVAFVESDAFGIDDMRQNAFLADEMQRIINILEDECKRLGFADKYKATIRGDVPTHMGFGSSTAIRLALVEGLYVTNKHKYNKDDIVRASGRGGTSGIGIEIYFHGGMVFDMGRATSSKFAPSSAMEQSEKSLPLVCKRVDMPPWEIGICVPDIKPKTETEEKEFFARTCPIDENQSYKALYHATYGVLASAMEDDIDTFASAINQIQDCQWKRAERSLYGSELPKVEKVLYECGAKSVGMSSLGATLFFVADDVADVVSKAQKQLGDSLLSSAMINNVGRTIRYD